MIRRRPGARWIAIVALAALVAVLAVSVILGRDDRRPYAFAASGQRIVPLAAGGWGEMAALFARPHVLLTIDDGPADAETDRRILDTLGRHRVRAIWFITCANLDPATSHRWRENRQTLRDIAARGHLLGNHGYFHRNLHLIADDRVALRKEIAGCSELIEAVAGVRPAYFRPPWGQSTPVADVAIAAAGMHSMLWSANSYDSLRADFKTVPAAFPAFIRQYPMLDIGRSAGTGDIVLMHDYPHTAAALDGVLRRWQQRGLVPVLPEATLR